jgi:two-component system, NarL family, nitrate/nitrite response regulator NarL
LASVLLSNHVKSGPATQEPVPRTLRVVLAGSAPERAVLRARLPPGVDVAAECATIAEARALVLEADAILTPRTRHPIERLDEPLTPREIEVLNLLAEGLPNKAIARRLGISDQTVKFHVSSICGKLPARNRTEAVRRAIRRGIVAV